MINGITEAQGRENSKKGIVVNRVKYARMPKVITAGNKVTGHDAI